MKCTLYVHNIYTEIEGVEAIDYLGSIFRYKSKRAVYTPAYQNGEWDGYVRLVKFKSFPTGLLERALKVLKKGKYEVDVVDERVNKEIDIKSNSLDYIVGNDKLYSHQQRMLMASFKYTKQKQCWHRGVINAATNAGKTHWAAAMINNLNNPHVIYIVHRRELVKQAYNFFSSIFGLDAVGYIQGKKYKRGNIIDIATVQTLYKNIKDANQNIIESLKEYNTMVMDECHLAGSDSYVLVGAHCEGASVRYLISGTPFDRGDEIRNAKIIGLSGKQLIKISKDELMAKKISRRPKIHLHEIERLYVYKNFKMAYKKGIIKNKTRNQIIKNLVLTNPDKYILIAVRKVKHLKILLNKLTPKVGLRNIRAISSTSPDREESLELFKKGEIRVLIATGIIREGINIPMTDMLICAQGGKSKIEVSQLSGRVERLKKGYDDVHIHDFMDKGPYLKDHSKIRLSVYQNPSNGFEIVEG